MRWLLTAPLSESREVKAGVQLALSPSTPFSAAGAAHRKVSPIFRISLPRVENPSPTHPEVCLSEDSRLREDGNQINYTLSQPALTPQAILPRRPSHEWVALAAAPPPGLCAQAQGCFTLRSSVGSVVQNFHPHQDWGTTGAPPLDPISATTLRGRSANTHCAFSCTRSCPTLSQEFPQSKHGTSFPLSSYNGLQERSTSTHTLHCSRSFCYTALTPGGLDTPTHPPGSHL